MHLIELFVRGLRNCCLWSVAARTFSFLFRSLGYSGHRHKNFHITKLNDRFVVRTRALHSGPAYVAEIQNRGFVPDACSFPVSVAKHTPGPAFGEQRGVRRLRNPASSPQALTWSEMGQTPTVCEPHLGWYNYLNLRPSDAVGLTGRSVKNPWCDLGNSSPAGLACRSAGRNLIHSLQPGD